MKFLPNQITYKIKKMQLVFASNNRHKIQEIQNLINDSIQILSLEDIGCTEDIPETADTIEGNAILKANYVTENYGYDCFADDTGLEIDYLNGAPGVYSARFAGEQKNNQDNIDKVLIELQNTDNRKANFKTVIALNLNKEQHLFTGIINGTIETLPKGIQGFGYDSIFQPDNYKVTFAEMNQIEKSIISHRGLAVKQLLTFLAK
jgi:XTP/dITP diphosphohydrolase